MSATDKTACRTRFACLIVKDKTAVAIRHANRVLQEHIHEANVIYFENIRLVQTKDFENIRSRIWFISCVLINFTVHGKALN
jgi:hypothetical protein